jgi:AbiV
MSKPLNKLTSEECFHFYKMMIQNSNVRWNSAQLLAQSQDYGGAINSHITSVEEMVKSFIFLLDSKGFELRKIDGMESIIRKSHSLRHFICFAMFVLNIFTEDLKKYISEIMKDPSAILMFINDENGMEVSVKWYLLRKIPFIKKEFYWFSQMEKIRQSGNHVDFDSQQKSPLEINADDYLEVYVRLNNVREVIIDFIKVYDSCDDEMLKQMNLVLSGIKTENLYTLVQKSLVPITTGRKNPFDLVKKFIKN